MKLNLLVIRSEDPERTMAFYQHLGFEFTYHRHGKGPFHYSVEVEGMVFEIYPPLKDQDQADNTLRLGFEVQQLDQLLMVLAESGVTILQTASPSKWGYRAVVQDPDGRKVELCER